MTIRPVYRSCVGVGREVPVAVQPIIPVMTSQVIASVWPLLAALAYLLVTCVLSVLSHMHQHAIEKHNRIIECMKLRREFESQFVKPDKDKGD